MRVHHLGAAEIGRSSGDFAIRYNQINSHRAEKPFSGKTMQLSSGMTPKGVPLLKMLGTMINLLDVKCQYYRRRVQLVRLLRGLVYKGTYQAVKMR
jgi:hypothetical protein